MGGQTYEPVRGPWFACPGSRTARRSPGRRSPGRRSARRSMLDARARRSPGRRSVMLSTWRTFSGCNRQTSHCPWFVKTWRSSLCSLSVIRAPGQWVIAHHARLVVPGYRLPHRTSLIFSRVSFSAFPVSRRACLFPGARVCDPGQRTPAQGSHRSI